jgi:hypothetical protein
MTPMQLTPHHIPPQNPHHSPPTPYIPPNHHQSLETNQATEWTNFPPGLASHTPHDNTNPFSTAGDLIFGVDLMDSSDGEALGISPSFLVEVAEEHFEFIQHWDNPHWVTKDFCQHGGS